MAQFPRNAGTEAGRHAKGAPLAKTGIKPKARTGSALGKFVGTGVNAKTAARPETTPSTASVNRTAGNQLDSINQQAPEPFRNPSPGAQIGPLTGTNLGNDDIKAQSGIKSSSPQTNMAAAGFKGGVGAGSDRYTGKPGARARNAFNKIGKPSFYGK